MCKLKKAIRACERKIIYEKKSLHYDVNFINEKLSHVTTSPLALLGVAILGFIATPKFAILKSKTKKHVKTHVNQIKSMKGNFKNLLFKKENLYFIFRIITKFI